MSNNKYVVKSLTPWMMDELLAFSLFCEFDLILLRKPDEFYKENLDQLRSNGVKFYVKPYSYDYSLQKLILILKLVIQNILKFRFNYNAVIGLKSMYWFFKLDLKHFSRESNLHAQFATQAAIVSLLIKSFYSNKPLLSFTFHAYDIYYVNTWFNLLLKNCQKAFSISEFNINYVREKYINSNKVVISRLGVFRKDIIRAPKKKSDVFTLGLMSWFVEKKGINYLLEAMNSLKLNNYKKVKLRLAGDGPLKKEYLDYIHENHLTSSVEYVGKIKGKQKKQFYNSIDAFILPSIKLKNDQDGIPVVLMEAIAYGLPIISTNISGIPEICLDNYNGILIKERDVQSIYDSIIELYKNTNKRIKYANNSYNMSDKYDIEKNSKNKLLSLKWI